LFFVYNIIIRTINQHEILDFKKENRYSWNASTWVLVLESRLNIENMLLFHSCIFVNKDTMLVMIWKFWITFFNINLVFKLFLIVLISFSIKRKVLSKAFLQLCLESTVQCLMQNQTKWTNKPVHICIYSFLLTTHSHLI
jgi:hypothetical protein